MNYYRRFIPFCPICNRITRDVICSDCDLELKKELLFEDIDVSAGGLSVRVTFISLYQGLMNQMINEYKFKSDKSLSLYFSNLMKLYIKRKSINQEKTLFLFAPSSKAGLKMRGFNQIELIFSHCDGLMYEDVFFLNDNSAKKQQKQLNKQERIVKSQNKYEIDKCVLFDKINMIEKIVVCDDIWTTGSTLTQMILLIRDFLQENNSSAITVSGLIFARAKDILAF